MQYGCIGYLISEIYCWLLYYLVLYLLEQNSVGCKIIHSGSSIFYLDVFF